MRLFFVKNGAYTKMSEFRCDKCDKEFIPEEGCYIGPKDPDNTTCSPMMAFTDDWQEMCAECNQG